ncbi:hypothetical protein [Acidisphaera sp. L21]|uniref:hypothetical protein n=1 Tax=Acidisphaera sp. L21 TaxID=1641851 RepID=UPI00131CDC32|nr:hypothetical protein [Acidisphaera sp. L21]
MRTYSYSSRNPLAAHNLLRSLPLFAAAPASLRPARTPLELALWELNRAMPDVSSAERQYQYARDGLGLANRQPRICRRRFQSQAMTFLNKSRAAVRAAHKRAAAAQAAVLALTIAVEA